MRILVTGANGHLGIRTIEQLGHNHEVLAIVRSATALAVVKQLDCMAVQLDYQDIDALAKAASDCDYIVHLVGIIKQSKRSRYVDAHESTCEILARAAEKTGVKHIITISILGSHIESDNACFESRARADQILMDSEVPVTILRVPMVLGESDYAAMAIHNRINRRFHFMFRPESLEQPIYAGDVVNAIESVIEHGCTSSLIELAGAESLSRRELIQRAASLRGKLSKTIAIPVNLGLWMAWLLEKLMNNPPVTRDMIDLLDHDDHIDVGESTKLLDIHLTDLDDMLAKVLPE